MINPTSILELSSIKGVVETAERLHDYTFQRLFQIIPLKADVDEESTDMKTESFGRRDH